ncbi:FGGY-family carbohydrate kinase [Neorhizobium sp. JUb45]|uniref:FGGY-family carbohydrate kinase n=1 Tax=unclassified Neorhizobium TaxID=2629175 RepID=UPI00104AB73D|nr:FGGY-family carbohydrate kinase [Neorhizobium sp. JUb45]TCR06282.1 FGGY-family pentulose kinase [Neorhizobium sp. JUb45]
MRDHIVAVDVGTTSARAAVFDRAGHLLARAKQPIEMIRPRENHAEHDSENIWSACCGAVRAALTEAGIAAKQVAALGFDATCSLVVRDKKGKPLPVSPRGENRFDTIVWLDHRAIGEAEILNASGHPVLKYSGETLSPEMQMPKLMWLKRHHQDTWAKTGFIFDLADFLTWKATGSAARSRCTLTAKWNYLSHEKPGWQADFLGVAGLEDLLERASLPEETVPVGGVIGHLTKAAAADLGLDTKCVVTSGMIDAYAGALGALGKAADENAKDVGALEQSVALIAGTSSCIVALNGQSKPGQSLWGPYYDALLPGHWLVEGGQSATGALLDHIVRMHAAGGEPTLDLHARIVSRIGELRAEEGSDLAPDLNILPDFHGNRSPLADPRATGVISGLTLDTSFDGLCRVYWRTCVAIALGIRHILEALAQYGYRFETLHITGGHVQNPLLLELYADVTGRKVVVPNTKDAVLLGTAMAAAVAGGLHENLHAAAGAMDQGWAEHAADPERTKAYGRDYKRFLAMVRHREELRRLDDDA